MVLLVEPNVSWGSWIWSLYELDDVRYIDLNNYIWRPYLARVDLISIKHEVEHEVLALDMIISFAAETVGTIYYSYYFNPFPESRLSMFSLEIGGVSEHDVKRPRITTYYEYDSWCAIPIFVPNVSPEQASYLNPWYLPRICGASNYYDYLSYKSYRLNEVMSLSHRPILTIVPTQLSSLI